MDLFQDQLDHPCQLQGSFSASGSFTTENKTINIIHIFVTHAHKVAKIGFYTNSEPCHSPVL